MNETRQFENENLTKGLAYLPWILLVIVVISLQLFGPVTIPHRFSELTVKWIVATFCILVFAGYLLFHQRFLRIEFSDLNATITLTTSTLIRGMVAKEYKYSSIKFTEGKDGGSLRKRPTEGIEIYYGMKRLIKLEKTAIGDACFESIRGELQRLPLKSSIFIDG